MGRMNGEQHEARFQRWLSEHLGLMRKIVRAFAESPHDQEDLFQDVLVNLWSSLPNFRGDAKETTWIYRVAFNTALAWKRGERRRHRQHAAILQQALTNGPPREPTMSQVLIDRLYAAIRQLPSVNAALVLMHLDGRSYQEMADVLGITENHIGVKLTRLRRLLAEQLSGVSDDL
jgi:RNA polymerase sigma-70 factor (ECF subfamily)